MTSFTHWLYLWHHLLTDCIYDITSPGNIYVDCIISVGCVGYLVALSIIAFIIKWHCRVNTFMISFWHHMTSLILYASPQIRWSCTDWDVFKSLKNRNGRNIHCSELAERVAQSHGALSLSLMVWRTTAAAAQQEIRIKYIGNWVKQRAHYIHTPWF